MKTYIALLENNRQSMANYLIILLADEYVLYTRTRNAYRNVKTTNIHNQPVLFEIQFIQLNDIIDRITKRIHELGYYTYSSLKMVAETAHLCETHCSATDYIGLKKELLMDHECIIESMKAANHVFLKEYGDENTSVFITRMVKEHEKMAWFLRSLK